MKILNDYLNELKNLGRDTKTLVMYKQTLESFLEYVEMKGLDVENLKRAEVQSFINEMSSKGYKNSTIKKYVTSINIFLDYYDFKKPSGIRYPTEIKEVEVAPDMDEAIKMVDSADSTKTKLQLKLMLKEGLRTCEIGNIKFEDIDLENDLLLVHGKQNKQREITLFQDVKDLILKQRQDNNFRKSTRDSEFLFGRPLTESAVKKAFNQLREVAGVNLKPHDLRKLATVSMFEAGVKIQDVSKFLGHSNVSITEKHYLKLQQSKVNGRIAEIMR